MGGRLAALMNRALPPSPPPVSELAPNEGEASSSSQVSVVGGRRKRKRKSSMLRAGLVYIILQGMSVE